MTKYVISLALASAYALASLYSTLYFGWLSATPLSADQSPRVQHDFFFWFWSFVVAVILCLLLGWRLARLRRQPPHVGSPGTELEFAL